MASGEKQFSMRHIGVREHWIEHRRVSCRCKYRLSVVQDLDLLSLASIFPGPHHDDARPYWPFTNAIAASTVM